jgi:hypothetical protein
MSNSGGNYILQGQGLHPSAGYAGTGYGAIPSVGQIGIGKASLSDDIFHLGTRGLTVRILPANGGIIISIRDENGTAQNSDLYVISGEQELGNELGKIITMHYLKKDNNE